MFPRQARAAAVHVDQTVRQVEMLAQLGHAQSGQALRRDRHVDLESLADKAHLQGMGEAQFAAHVDRTEALFEFLAQFLQYGAHRGKCGVVHRHPPGDGRGLRGFLGVWRGFAGLAPLA